MININNPKEDFFDHHQSHAIQSEETFACPESSFFSKEFPSQ